MGKSVAGWDRVGRGGGGWRVDDLCDRVGWGKGEVFEAGQD